MKLLLHNLLDSTYKNTGTQLESIMYAWGCLTLLNMAYISVDREVQTKLKTKTNLDNHCIPTQSELILHQGSGFCGIAKLVELKSSETLPIQLI